MVSDRRPQFSDSTTNPAGDGTGVDADDICGIFKALNPSVLMAIHHGTISARISTISNGQYQCLESSADEILSRFSPLTF